MGVLDDHDTDIYALQCKVKVLEEYILKLMEYVGWMDRPVLQPRLMELMEKYKREIQ